jgi:hypothetical protein
VQYLIDEAIGRFRLPLIFLLNFHMKLNFKYFMEGVENMNDIRISFDSVRYGSKPKETDAGGISNRVGKTVIHMNPNNIKKYLNYIGKDGHTFCPATFRGGNRNKDNFEQQQLLALDFDGGISFEDVKKRADHYDLPMLFAYDTFGSKDHDKFRVVFMNDVPIADRKAAEAVSKGLGAIFPEADASCYKDVSKMYYGGKEVLHYDDRLPVINIESLFRNMTHRLKEEFKINHYKDKISKFSDETGIKLNKNGLLDVTVTEDPTEIPGATLSDQNGKNSPTAIIYSLNRIDDGEIFPTKYYCINFVDNNRTERSSVGKRNLKNHEPYRSSLLNDIEHSCSLFREFETGSRKLNHDELFGLAANMIQVDSGHQKFKDILLKNSHFYNDKSDKWDRDLKYMKQLDYAPYACDGFCPYRKQCVHGTNILSTVKPKRGMMERMPGYAEKFYAVEDVEADVYRAVHTAYRATGRMLETVKAQTAIGKTTAYLKLMTENPTDRFLIAAPTNILKNEIYVKAHNLGMDVSKTPSLEEIKNEIPSKAWKHIQRLYKTGRHRSVHPYIFETLKKKDIPCLGEYLKEREKLKSFGGSVITTHRYLLNMDEKRLREYDAVIIDEDIILKSIIPNQVEIKISDLKKLSRRTVDNRLANKTKKLLKLAETKSCIELDGFERDDDKEEIDGISTPFDIPSFCLAERFFLREASKERNLKEDTVVFIKPITFKNIKYIMVSATADEDICRKYLGEGNVNFCECKRAEYKGSLYQYPQKSMSRTGIDSNPGIIERLKKRFGIDNVITFKKYDIGPLHFGNTEGSNTLEGEDILVVGTPYHAEFLYKLVAFMMGLDFDDDAKMKSQYVIRNGCRFRFTTYDDENLRAVHFWMIESELEQAVGRARLLRNDCDVHLFSNYALSQAKIVKEFEYDKD